MSVFRDGMRVLLIAAAVLCAVPAAAQESLEAGKTAPQIFASDCAACHKGPQGLARMSSYSLPQFLSQHYTSSRETANALAAYLQAAASGQVPQARKPPAKPATAKPKAKPDDKAGGASDAKASADKPDNKPPAPIPAAKPEGAN